MSFLIICQSIGYGGAPIFGRLPEFNAAIRMWANPASWLDRGRCRLFGVSSLHWRRRGMGRLAKVLVGEVRRSVRWQSIVFMTADVDTGCFQRVRFFRLALVFKNRHPETSLYLSWCGDCNGLDLAGRRFVWMFSWLPGVGVFVWFCVMYLCARNLTLFLMFCYSLAS